MAQAGCFSGLPSVIVEMKTITLNINAAAEAAKAATVQIGTLTAAAAGLRGLPTFEGTQTNSLTKVMQGAQDFLPTDANPWAKLIRDIIKNELDQVTGGKETISQALAKLQKDLSAFYSDFEVQIADPKTSKEARDFFQQLIHLILSGNLYQQELGDKLTASQKGIQAALDAIAKRESDMKKIADDLQNWSLTHGGHA